MIKGKKVFWLALALCLCLAGMFPKEAFAAADLESAGIKWDLVADKVLKFKTRWGIVGDKKMKVEITDYALTDAAKEGYKKLTFTANFTDRDAKPTSDEAEKMAAFYKKWKTIGGYY